MYDMIVIGGGPAGMTAALYGLRNGKSVLVLEKAGFGGQITHSPQVENIPGFASLSGNEFADKFLEQILAQGAEVELETAAEVLDEGDRKIVRTEEGNTFEGRTVILATGVKHRMTGLPGEEELVGNSISFCAVCDGDFYKGKTVAVVGGGNSALQEAILLAGKCKEVIVVQDLDFFTGEQRLQEILFAKPNVRTMTGMRLEGYLRKDGELTGLQVRKTATGETSEIPCDGVFLAIGLIPENEPYRALAELDERGYFASGEDCRTKTKGIFCAGDCRRKNVRQVTTATADGAIAALAACRYLDGQE